MPADIPALSWWLLLCLLCLTIALALTGMGVLLWRLLGPRDHWQDSTEADLDDMCALIREQVPHEGQARPDVAPDWHSTPTGEYPYVSPSRYGRRRRPRAVPVCTRTVRDTGPAPAAMRWYETWRDAATATAPLTDPRWATVPLWEVARG